MTSDELKQALRVADTSNNEGYRLGAKIEAIAAFLLGMVGIGEDAAIEPPEGEPEPISDEGARDYVRGIVDEVLDARAWRPTADMPPLEQRLERIEASIVQLVECIEHLEAQHEVADGHTNDATPDMPPLAQDTGPEAPTSDVDPTDDVSAPLAQGEDATAPAQDAIDYEALTKGDLISLAGERGLHFPSGSTKATIIEALSADDAKRGA